MLHGVGEERGEDSLHEVVFPADSLAGEGDRQHGRLKLVQRRALTAIAMELT